MTTKSFRFVYDREVVAKTGTIKIYDASNNLLKTINPDDPYVYYNYTQDNRTKVEADISELGITWTKNTNYTITVDAGFVEEVGNNKSLSPAQNINYTTPNEPFVESSIPANLATNVVDFTIQLNFDEAVEPLTGNFYLYESPSNTLLATIPVSDAKVTYNENIVSLNLNAYISLNKTYYITADANSLENGFSFQFLGIADDSVLKFTTSDITFNFSLTNPDLNIEYFGSRVDISPSYIAIASSGKSTNTVNGKIYIYDRSGNFIRSFADPVTFVNSVSKGSWPFGMKITDQYLAFGSQDYTTGQQKTIIYVYDITDGTLIRNFEFLFDIPPDPPLESAYSGSIISIDGERIMFGIEDIDNLTNKIYVYNITSGNLLRTVTVNVLSANTLNGFISVGLSGDKFIFDKGNEGSSGDTNNNLEAYVYSVNSGTLLHTFTFTDPEETRAVAINSNYIVIKTVQNIRIYDASTYSLLHTISDATNHNQPISMSENYAIVGAKLIDVVNGKLLKDFSGSTIEGISITGTNMRSAISNSKIVSGFSSQNTCLIFTNPIQ